MATLSYGNIARFKAVVSGLGLRLIFYLIKSWSA